MTINLDTLIAIVSVVGTLVFMHLWNRASLDNFRIESRKGDYNNE